MKISDLVMRAAKYDEDLAKDLAEYVRGRQYGLVYEASKPEFVRLWKKPIAIGDLVNILPPRGMLEDTKNDADPADVTYKVINMNDGFAVLQNMKTGEMAEESVNDVVAIARFDQPIYAGLHEIERVERGGNKPYNVIINGENYHALQTLIYAYQSKVDCIYIDPPYNSGAKDWKYNNNYVGADDVYRHSKWLTYMEDRLRLAKKLLNPKDSVLIVTIDEKEYLRLGLLLEQLFPEARIQMVSSMINKKAATRTQEFSRAGEYIYFLMFGDCVPGSARINMMTGELNDDKKLISYEGLRRRGGKRRESPGCFYPLFINESDGSLHSVGEPLALGVDRHSVIPPFGTWAAWPINADDSESRWQISRERFLQQLYDSTLVLSSFDKERESATVLYLKNADLKKIEEGIVKIVGKDDKGQLVVELAYDEIVDNAPKSIWVMNSHDASVYGTTLHKRFIPESNFSFPKSLYAVEDCLRFFIEDKPNALVVDFFAGSGTTAHAVMRLNHQDNGHRRSISVTNNEVSAGEIKFMTKQGLRQGDDKWEEHGIARYVTWPRLKAAITGFRPDGMPIKGNYGIEVDKYIKIEADMISSNTGEKLRGTYYKKQKVQDPSVPDPFPMSNGFEENIVFFDIEYLEPSIVSADLAFDEIAPILWLRGGCKGGILKRHNGFVIGETYAVLFSHKYKRRFIEAVEKIDNIKTIFIVTDIAERYRDMCIVFPERDVVQLYDSYLRSFEINAIG